MYRNKLISVSIPAHNESEFIPKTLNDIPDFVDYIIITDDNSRDNTLEVVKNIAKANKKILLIESKTNEGKGASVLKAHNKAVELGADILVAIDSDGQMDTSYMSKLIDVLIDTNAAFSQGNRFANRDSLKAMPFTRFIGNLIFSVTAKLFTGYWNIMDPMSGYTAIKSNVFKKLDQKRIAKRFNFEPTLITQLSILQEKMAQISIPTIYGKEVSDIKLIRDGYTVIKGLFFGFLRKIATNNEYNNNCNNVPIIKFASLAFILGLIMVFLIPPFQKPDEVAHYYRAASYAHGNIACINASLVITNREHDFVEQMHVDDIKFKYNTKFDMNYLSDYSTSNTKQTIPVKNILCSQLTLMHLVPAIGLYIGRLLGFNELYGFYSARITCLIGAIYVTILAIKQIPFGKRTVVVATLLPMTLNQYTSIGYDAILIPSTFLVISIIMKAYKKVYLSTRDKILTTVLYMLIILTKIAYAPLVLLPLIFLGNRPAWKKYKVLRFIFISISLIVIGIIGQYVFIGLKSGAIDSEYAPVAQLTYILHNPLHIIVPIINAWLFNSSFYILSLIGVLGWLDLYLPTITYVSIVLLSILYICEKNDVRLSISERVNFLVIIILTTLLIFISMYILSTYYKGSIVMGVQGRYFTPVLILGLLLIAHYFRKKFIHNLYLVYALGIFSITIQTIIAIILRYYIL